jgi:serine protease Do
MTANSKLIRIWAAVIMLGLAILACGPTPAVVTPTAAQPQPTPIQQQTNTNPTNTNSRANLISATVQIFGVHIRGSNISPFYVGSGSIISSDGLILTNAHVADPAAVGETDATPDALVIGIVKSEDQPPTYAYRAEVKAIDGYMDLAVIQVTATVKGDRLDPSSLNLPYVTLGNSDDVHVGDHISILGFPAIGGDTITYTSGDVSGFSAEDQLGDRAWIKTDATISGGNSGGMGTNDQGLLIGVPSIASSGANAEATDCRVIQDTNGDGVLDNKDTCIPIGGFINALRPVNLAMPLIKAAQSGLAYTSPYGGQQVVQGNTPGNGGEQMSQLQWYTVDSQGNLGDEVSAYSSGTTVMVAAFQFSGFTNGESWSEIWTSGGNTLYSGSYNWDQGSDGTYGTSLSHQGDPLPDGKYHLELYAGGGSNPLTQGDVVIGTGASDNQPTSGGGVTLSGTVSDENSGNPISGAYVIVLKTGNNFNDWADAGYPKDAVLTYAKTDSNGEYVLPVKLSRNTPYSLVASAEGYIDSYGDDLVWTDQDPSNYTMDITLGQ